MSTLTHIEIIRAALESLGWSQARLARESTVDEWTISQMLQGEAKPQRATLERLASALHREGVNVSADDLVAGVQAASSRRRRLPAMPDSLIRMVSRWMLLPPESQDAVHSAE